MKLCPTCHLRYPADVTHCFVDRAELADAPDPYIGTTVAGRYQIEAQLGEGGMATVYRARNILQDRPVAIKIVRQELAGDARLRERFRREAVSARRLAHPNIIQILDESGTDDETPYLVMEFLHGETLESVLEKRGGPLSLARAIDLILQVTAGLARAHDFGVIHRDLKPDNIFVCVPDDEGREAVKILDFGIARSMHDPRLTGKGEVFGTPQYMAPERITSIDAGPAADLYALGVILFQCVTGQLPFQAKDVTGFLIKHLREAPPRPSTLADGIPPELEQLILQCLEKDPAKRPVDAHAVSRALQTLSTRYPRTARNAGSFVGPLPQGPPAPGDGPRTEPNAGVGPGFKPTSLERWQRRVTLIGQMVNRAYPREAPPRVSLLLARTKQTVARMQDRHGVSVQDQARIDAVGTRTREAQARFGRAMDALGQDVSVARQEAQRVRKLEQQYEVFSRDAAVDFATLHAQVAAAPAVPSDAIADLYRAALAQLERVLAAQAEQARARAYIASRESEVKDLEFQISALRSQLAKLSQTSEDETKEIQRRLAESGAETASLEEQLIRDSGELVEALRGREELGELFAELEADAA